MFKPHFLRFMLAVSVSAIAGLALSLLQPAPVRAAKPKVRIGVLAYRGPEEALKMWAPTSEYLSAKIPVYSFETVPLDFHEIGPAVKKGDVDFVIANTSIYVELEALYGATRILTLKNFRRGGAYMVFGGVIFCRKDREDIKTLNDLRGKSLMAVDEISLGGWQMQWLELKRAGINPFRDLKKLGFRGTHDKVVYAVRDGLADAGTVRTDELERMTEEGLIAPGLFKIVNKKQAENFPFALSTDLYPEWPFAKVRHTDDELSQKTAIALLSMPSGSPAAKAAKIAGWTTPLNYQPVHDLMKELRIGPYRDFGKVRFTDFLRRYWYLFLLAAAVLSVMGAVTVFVVELNGRLHRAKIEAVTAKESLQRLVESSLDVIIAVDADRRITEFNLSAQRTFGYTIEEVLGKHVDLLYDDPAEGAKIQEALRGTGQFTGEIINRRSGGESFTSFISASSLFDSHGRPAGSMGISRDITERKTLEKHLTKMFQAVEQSPNSVIITDTGGLIEYVNPKFTEVTGYEQYEVIGGRPNILESGLMPPDTYEEVWSAITNGREWHGELANRKKNGAVYWEYVSISPVKNSSGEVTNFVAVKTDITERRMLEERFREMLAEHLIILENANIGIALVKDRKMRQVNRKFEELFGYQRHEIIGGDKEMLFADRESYERLGSEAYDLMASGQTYSGELIMKHRSGDAFWCRLFGKAIDPADLSKGVIWLLEDITERKESEQKLEEQQRRLRELNRDLEKIVAEEVAKGREKDRIMVRQSHLADLGKLAASITHEINTPMTYIKGNVELLKVTADDICRNNPAKEEIFVYFGPIEDGIKRVSHIIESMKHISGFSKKEKVPANVFSTIVYAGRMIYNRARHITNVYVNDRPFNLDTGKDEEEYMADIADRSIEQVWIIILNNALDELSRSDVPFNRRYIKIGISHHDGRIRVVFRDNAGGIPADVIDRIFDMFVSTKPQSGMGIGLNVAKAIIEDHGGDIRAYNEDGGAVFEVLL